MGVLRPLLPGELSRLSGERLQVGRFSCLNQRPVKWSDCRFYGEPVSIAVSVCNPFYCGYNRDCDRREKEGEMSKEEKFPFILFRVFLLDADRRLSC